MSLCDLLQKLTEKNQTEYKYPFTQLHVPWFLSPEERNSLAKLLLDGYNYNHVIDVFLSTTNSTVNIQGRVLMRLILLQLNGNHLAEMCRRKREIALFVLRTENGGILKQILMARQKYRQRWEDITYKVCQLVKGKDLLCHHRLLMVPPFNNNNNNNEKVRFLLWIKRHFGGDLYYYPHLQVICDHPVSDTPILDLIQLAKQYWKSIYNEKTEEESEKEWKKYFITPRNIFTHDYSGNWFFLTINGYLMSDDKDVKALYKWIFGLVKLGWTFESENNPKFKAFCSM